MTQPPEPAFAAPWHAQVFALTVHLNARGRLPWTDWAEAFGATLARHGLTRDLDGGEDYFRAWLETLEQILQREGLVEAAALERLRADWERAYLSTPHGAQVRLPQDRDSAYSSTSSMSD